MKEKDQRKIPQLFRAVERDSSPKVYFGYLISDDGFNFVCFASHDGDDSHFKERVLEKKEFNFSKINKEEFWANVRGSVSKMLRNAEDLKLDYEAAVYNHSYASDKLKEIMGES